MPVATKKKAKKKVRKKRKPKKRKPEPKAPTGIIGGRTMEKAWKTPPRLADPSRVYFGGKIPFDAATSADNPMKARKFVTAEDYSGAGSLAIKWPRRVFINPPYGDLLPPFLGKIGWEALMDNEILGILPASRWEQRYFQMALFNGGRGVMVCTPRGRVDFIRPGEDEARKRGGNTYATVVVGWNVDERRFVEAFSTVGGCWKMTGAAPTPPEHSGAEPIVWKFFE